jgi:hypothetical protein
MPEDPDLLNRRLEHARRRLTDAAPQSPDWDAAMDAIEDLEQRLLVALAAAAVTAAAAAESVA